MMMQTRTGEVPPTIHGRTVVRLALGLICFLPVLFRVVLFSMFSLIIHIIV
jgi:hypothetical protein